MFLSLTDFIKITFRSKNKILTLEWADSDGILND